MAWLHCCRSCESSRIEFDEPEPATERAVSHSVLCSITGLRRTSSDLCMPPRLRLSRQAADMRECAVRALVRALET